LIFKSKNQLLSE